MLVKLGDVWVDPAKVITVQPSYYDVQATVRDQYACAFFKLGHFSSEEEAKSKSDEYASIVNNAVGQSYGGEDEENPANP